MKCIGCEYLNIVTPESICLHPLAKGSNRVNSGKGCIISDIGDVEQPVWCPLSDDGDIYD